MSKLKGLFIVILIVVVAFSGGLFAYLNGIGAVDPGNEEDVTVVIPEGSGASAIVGVLDEAGLVKNSTFAKINARIGGYNSLQANTYVFNKSMTLPEIMDVINTGDFNYISKSSFRVAEGARLTQCADALAEIVPHSSEEILAVWDDEAFVREMIDKYWFLTDDVLDEDIIHPLEGYLFPDTYYFDENTEPEQVIAAMLARFEEKVIRKR